MPELTEEVVSNKKQNQLAGLLAERGIEIPADVFQEMVIKAVDHIRKVRSIDPREGLTPAEVGELVGAGFELDDSVRGRKDPLAEAASEFGAMLASSQTAAQVGVRLGVKNSRVRQRLGEGTLYGIKVDGKWRVPVFQFEDGAEVLGLAAVLKVIDRSVHPLTLRRWLVSPNPDLEIDHRRVTPLGWLKSGGDASALVELATDL